MLLPFALSQPVREFWSNNGCKVDFEAFNGEHSIPPVMIHKFQALLDA